MKFSFRFLFYLCSIKGVSTRRPFDRYLNVTMKGDESWKFNIDWWHKFQIVKGIVDFHFSLIQNGKMIMLNFSFFTSPHSGSEKIISFSYFDGKKYPLTIFDVCNIIQKKYDEKLNFLYCWQRRFRKMDSIFILDRLCSVNSEIQQREMRSFHFLKIEFCFTYLEKLSEDEVNKIFMKKKSTFSLIPQW
jgi:hypothetical protein